MTNTSTAARRPMERTLKPVETRTAPTVERVVKQEKVQPTRSGSIQRAKKLVSRARGMLRDDQQEAWDLLYEAETALNRVIGGA